jgi:hypothetical protein
MLPHQIEKNADTPHGKWFWMAVAALVFGQLVAFWMLCSWQVRKAEIRNAGLQLERTALADCLRQAAGATRSSCAARLAPSASALSAGGAKPGDGDAALAGTSSATAVNFTLR